MAYFGRGKNSIHAPYNLSDMYPSYVEYVEKKELYILNRNDFITVCGDFNKGIVDGILEGKIFYLPLGMGHIDIEKFKSKKPRQEKYIDWVKTVEEGKRIYHTNLHSDGYRYRVVWWRLDSKHKGATKFYNFVPARRLKRTMAKLLKERQVDYFESATMKLKNKKNGL